jgi:hypothetical protein
VAMRGIHVAIGVAARTSRHVALLEADEIEKAGRDENGDGHQGQGRECDDGAAHAIPLAGSGMEF